MADETPFSYYADLNPRYGARYERRWAVFLRRSATEVRQTHLHYATRKAAEANAAKLNAAESDPYGTPSRPMPREWDAPADDEATLDAREIAAERAAYLEEQEAEWLDAQGEG